MGDFKVKKKICFITAARSEYGLLKWLILDMKNSDLFDVRLIVTGGHLSNNQGKTIESIISEGLEIDEVVDAKIDSSTNESIAESMGRLSQMMAKTFNKVKPDYIVVLGDRYELLPICSTALIMRIKIIHISGGDTTEGAIDDEIRNAVTMMSDIHFPGTEEAAQNIVRMRGNSNNVWAVGEPGLDYFNRETLMSREELAKELGLDINKKWILLTYHPETKNTLVYNLNSIKACIKSILTLSDYQTLITYANADLGGNQINDYSESVTRQYPDVLKVIPSLGNKRYLSFMKQVEFIIGNSSSGIVEAPFMNIPVINVGNRQKGRYQCGNIYQCNAEYNDICLAIESITNNERTMPDDLNFWGDGYTSEKILNILATIIY